MKAIGWTLLIIFGLALGVGQAWVGSTLWRWFIVDAFGWPALTVAHVYGILLIGAWARAANHDFDKERPKKELVDHWGEMIGRALVYTLILGIAAGARLFLA